MTDRSPGSALLDLLANIYAAAGGLPDIDIARDDELDTIAENYGMKRQGGESDASFRSRIKRHPLLKPHLLSDLGEVAQVLAKVEEPCTCGNPEGGTHQKWCKKGTI